MAFTTDVNDRKLRVSTTCWAMSHVASRMVCVQTAATREAIPNYVTSPRHGTTNERITCCEHTTGRSTRSWRRNPGTLTLSPPSTRRRRRLTLRAQKGSSIPHRRSTTLVHAQQKRWESATRKSAVMWLLGLISIVAWACHPQRRCFLHDCLSMFWGSMHFL